MGSCHTKIPLTTNMILDIATSTDPTKTLLELNLHYADYDKYARKTIDELTKRHVEALAPLPMVRQ